MANDELRTGTPQSFHSRIDWDRLRSDQERGVALLLKRAALLALIPLLFYVAWRMSQRPIHDPGWRPDA